MKQFIISEQEKQRILEMHQNATLRQYLMEESTLTFVLTITLQYTLLPNGKKKYSTTALFSANFGVDTSTLEFTKLTFLNFAGLTLNPYSAQVKSGNFLTGSVPLTPEQINTLKPYVEKGQQVKENTAAANNLGEQYKFNWNIVEKQLPPTQNPK